MDSKICSVNSSTCTTFNLQRGEELRQQPRQSRIWRKWVSVLKVTQFTTHVRSCSAACVPLPLGVFHNTYKHTPSTITALFQRCLRVGIRRERKMKHTGLNICMHFILIKMSFKKHSYILKNFYKAL